MRQKLQEKKEEEEKKVKGVPKYEVHEVYNLTYMN